MKTKITLFLAILSIALFSSCSKEDDSFDYPMETLYGTWEGTEVNAGDGWYDIPSWGYNSKFQFDITFYNDGTYYGSGYFGTGAGTYEAIGNKIYTYVSGKKYITYTIKSLYNSNAELTMSMDGSDVTIDVRVEKEE